MKKNYFYFLSLIFLIIFGFILRFKGLNYNYSFWTDEEHVAIFARAILERGKPILENGYTTQTYQWFWYWLTAGSFKIFGLNEMAARSPALFFGVLTIPAIYFVAKEFFDGKVGLVAAALTTFLTIEILWSRQARPYQAIQFFYLMEIFFFLKLITALEDNKNGFGWLLGLITLITISSLMHWFGLLPIVFFSIYLIFCRWKLVKKIVKKEIKNFRRKPLQKMLFYLFILFVFALFLYKINFLFAVKHFFLPAFGKVGFYNHAWYYHSFLWRQYGLISFLSLIGLSVALSKNWKKNSLILVIFIIVFFLINFRLRVPFTRYFYPLFPFLLILFAYSLSLISEILASAWLKKSRINLKNLFLFILTIFLIMNGYKFTFKPKSIYSLNTDMQEIPEVDFKNIYNFIKNKTIGVEDWILINTWPDHATWYLGEGSPDYWLRDRKMTYGENKDLLSGALILGSREELIDVIKNNNSGFIILESWETFIPQGTREFIRENLKKEAEFDRIYSIQPRLWPVEIYSWGI